MARPPLHARPPADPAEAHTLRRLAHARHAPASWIQRARIITTSWDGATVPTLARQLGCHPKTVYKWLHRFNTLGIDGLADAPRSGLPRRITEHQRGQIIALARSAPPGQLVQGGEGLLSPPNQTAPAVWTLDTLTAAARHAGIHIGRSQVRPVDGQVVTLTGPSRNSARYQDLLAAVEAANPTGSLVVVTDNLSTHSSSSTRTWLAAHPRIRQVFIPTGACWLNLQEGWWRLFRREALAGQSFANPDDITLATRVATAQLNARARPWVWGRPPPPVRYLRRRFIYRI